MSLAETCRRHPLAYVAAACALAVLCLNLVPGATPGEAAAQTLAAAACIVAVLALADPAALKTPRRRADRGRLRAALPAGAFLLAIALAAGLASAAFLPLDGLAAAGSQAALPAQAVQAGKAPAPLASVALFGALCLATGVFEEALFRGVMFRGFAASLRASHRRRPVLVAAVASALVFGALHVTGAAAAAAPPDGVAAAQFALKPLQAALFGFIMAGLYARTGSLWLVAALHAAYNFLSEAFVFAATGALPATYVTGSSADLAVLAVSTALFVPLALRAARHLAREA